MSKAVVAREAVCRFNPDAAVVAHHGNVKSPEYGVEYFRGFDVVMNALDNVAARRSVLFPFAAFWSLMCDSLVSWCDLGM